MRSCRRILFSLRSLPSVCLLLFLCAASGQTQTTTSQPISPEVQTPASPSPEKTVVQTAVAAKLKTAKQLTALVQQAALLAQQGEYPKALEVYRELYGATPPSGTAALAYYETEAATEGGRSQALAGLRALGEQNPGDVRYQAALGRLLTYDPKTRTEGRKLLAKYPNDHDAAEALRQSLLWDAQNLDVADDIRAYLAHHKDAQLSRALHDLKEGDARMSASTPAVTEEQRTSAAVIAILSADDLAANRTLNAKRFEEAQSDFQATLRKSPNDPDALTGLGYIRLQQSNFGDALSFLVQAKQRGSKDPGLDGAIASSRLWYTLGKASTAFQKDDFATSEEQYRAALALRSTSTEALDGLGLTLLKSKQPEAAVPYFAQFTRLKSSAEHAWRGLFLAELGAGNVTRALQTERQAPPAVQSELAKDPLFMNALSSAYSQAGRDADALRVSRSTLDLPFSSGMTTLEAEAHFKYAGLLARSNQLSLAADQYRQVLALDQSDSLAWLGLVQAEHGMKLDEQALQILESMPPANHVYLLRQPFGATVASIYRSQGRIDQARQVADEAAALQTTGNPQVAKVAESKFVRVRLGLATQRPNGQTEIGSQPATPALSLPSTKGLGDAFGGSSFAPKPLAAIPRASWKAAPSIPTADHNHVPVPSIAVKEGAAPLLPLHAGDVSAGSMRAQSQQVASSFSGESKPPVEDYDTPVPDGVQTSRKP